MLPDARLDTEERKEAERKHAQVLATIDLTRPLPPPPSGPPSPSSSQGESTGWLVAAKDRLAPTNELLTAAQQIIQAMKTREKRSQEKSDDPAMLNANIHPSASPQRVSIMGSSLTPSPMRSIDATSSSPSHEEPPLYARFSAKGELNIPETLLTVTKRFERLEKWTVAHVRALEDRMGDVERWLVDKEKEKEEEKERESLRETQKQNSNVQSEIMEMKEEMTGLQGRVGELGRDMARISNGLL